MIKKRARKSDECSTRLSFDIATFLHPSLMSPVSVSVAKNYEAIDVVNTQHPCWFLNARGRRYCILKRRKISFLFVNCFFRVTSDRRSFSWLYFFTMRPVTMIWLGVLFVVLLFSHGSDYFYVSAWSSFPVLTQHQSPPVFPTATSNRKRRTYQSDLPTLYGSAAEEGEIGVKRSNSSYQLDSFWVQKPGDLDDDEDVPRPTENGGYSHTQASRAKISAANKGKTPWNKGLQRPEDVKARIAAGVRAKNRERFLLKLQEMGITEEEYDEQKRKERNEKEAEKRARRTEKGGYRPTEETKRKISEILKQKFSTGEIKPRFIQPVNVRRGFTHSDETRQKISESLRRRWATDSEYRAKMVEMSNRVNSSEDVRRKISASLKQKWQSDDEFRLEMLTKIATRKPRMDNPDGNHGSHSYTDDHRARISAAMKAKWQDAEYREKTLQSLASRRVVSSSHSLAEKSMVRNDLAQPLTGSNASGRKSSANEQIKKSIPKSNGFAAPISQQRAAVKTPKQSKLVADDFPGAIRPVQPKTSSQRKEMSIVPKTNMAEVDARSKSPHSVGEAFVKNHNVVTASPSEISISKASTAIKDLGTEILPNESESRLEANNEMKMVKGTNPPDASANAGSVDLLKTERRDLYDLLYGDDERNEEDEFDDVVALKPFHAIENVDVLSSGKSTGGTLSSMLSQLDDENLDTFDPYGLDDF
jgi:NUMOD3 motif